MSHQHILLDFFFFFFIHLRNMLKKMITKQLRGSQPFLNCVLLDFRKQNYLEDLLKLLVFL
jgi:hypothetical protein